MTLEFLNPNTYTFAGGFPVKSGRDLIIPDSIVLSQTMLVKWQIRQLVKGATIEQIPPATLSAVLEIPGMGVLDRSDSQIQPSQQGKDVVQLWTIDPSLPYKITLSGVSDLITNSVLEFYSSGLSMAITNNIGGTTVDMTAVTAAIAAGSAAQVAATQAAQAAQTRKVQTIVESTYNATVWSNTPANHVATPPDPNRLAIILVNTSSKRVYFDLFTNIANKATTPQYDSYMEAGGTISVGPDEAGLGVMLYALTGTGNSPVLINMEF
jgi:hypothetical protein